MKSIEVADRYAEALYELGKEEGILEELQSDLAQVNEVINTNEYFFPFLTHPLVPDEDKKRIIDEIFGSDMRVESINFLKILVQKDRESYFPLISERVKKLRMDKEEIVEVTVTLPSGFDREETVSKIETRLAEITEREVWITEVNEDDELIGGIRLKVGEQVIDGSVKARLEGLRDFVLEGGK